MSFTVTKQPFQLPHDLIIQHKFLPKGKEFFTLGKAYSVFYKKPGTDTPAL